MAPVLAHVFPVLRVYVSINPVPRTREELMRECAHGWKLGKAVRKWFVRGQNPIHKRLLVLALNPVAELLIEPARVERRMTTHRVPLNRKTQRPLRDFLPLYAIAINFG